MVETARRVWGTCRPPWRICEGSLEQTAVIETARLVWRTDRPPMARLQEDFEQETGIEPVLSVWRTDVPPMTLHLLDGLRRDLVFGSSSAPERVRDPSWVGWESNPRFDGLRGRCKANVCYQPKSSHPLESNQNLSGFSQARRPTTQEWDVAVREILGTARTALLLWVPASAPSSSSLFGCHRSPGTHWAHLGRWRVRDFRERTPHALAISIEITSRKTICCCVAGRDARKRLRAAWFPLAARFSARRRSRQVRRGRGL